MGYATRQMFFAKTSLIVPSLCNRKNGEELSLGYRVTIKSNILHIQPHFRIFEDETRTK